MVKQKKQLRNEAEWQDVRIKRDTIRSLKQLQLNLGMRKYDEVINYLIIKEGSQCV